jgi:hypothetical protein
MPTFTLSQAHLLLFMIIRRFNACPPGPLLSLFRAILHHCFTQNFLTTYSKLAIFRRATNAACATRNYRINADKQQ